MNNAQSIWLPSGFEFWKDDVYYCVESVIIDKEYILTVLNILGKDGIWRCF